MIENERSRRGRDAARNRRDREPGERPLENGCRELTEGNRLARPERLEIVC